MKLYSTLLHNKCVENQVRINNFKCNKDNKTFRKL